METLKKLDYTDLQQFIEDLNHNFAVVENSPYFKGVPGNKGEDGEQGTRGERGAKFIFIELKEFEKNFKGELRLSSDIDIQYLNNKLIDVAGKQKLLSSLKLTEFVDKDVVVLYNTNMVSYDAITNKFIDTGINFNEGANIQKNIREIVVALVKSILDDNPALKNIKNVFKDYPTHAKNYADTNNLHTTTQVTSTSIYEPYIKDYNKKGIEIDGNKYIAIGNNIVGKNDKTTIVGGAIRQYIKLLQNTISNLVNETLTSDYGVGVGQNPVMVLLQNDQTSGLMIGYRENENLKDFCNIYKNADNELILESNLSKKIATEKGTLKIHQGYMTFNKLVKFEDDLEISKDTRLFGDIKTSLLNTGKYVKSHEKNHLHLELGDASSTGMLIHNFINEKYQHHKNMVLVTDHDGVLLKKYVIENGNLNISEKLDELINRDINSSSKLVTSNYLGSVITKLNIISSFVKNSYFTKDNFTDGSIGSLSLKDNLTLKKFPSIVLTTDRNGNIVGTYSIEDGTLNNNLLQNYELLDTHSVLSDKKILTSKYYNYLAQKINNTTNLVKNDYYTKSDWETPTRRSAVKKIHLDTAKVLLVNTNFTFNEVLESTTKDQLTIGKEVNTTITFGNTKIYYTHFKNGFLHVDSQGKLSVKDIEPPMQTDNGRGFVEWDTVLKPSDTNTERVVTQSVFYQIVNKVNKIVSRLKEKYYDSEQLASGNVSTDIITRGKMRTNQIKVVGDDNNGGVFEATNTGVNIKVGQDGLTLKDRDNNFNKFFQKDGFLKLKKNKVVVQTGAMFIKGQIIWYYGNTIPDGWLLCDGRNGTPDLIGKFIKGATNTESKNYYNIDKGLSSQPKIHGIGDLRLKNEMLPYHQHLYFDKVHNEKYSIFHNTGRGYWGSGDSDADNPSADELLTKQDIKSVTGSDDFKKYKMWSIRSTEAMSYNGRTDNNRPDKYIMNKGKYRSMNSRDFDAWDNLLIKENNIIEYSSPNNDGTYYKQEEIPQAQHVYLVPIMYIGFDD